MPLKIKAQCILLSVKYFLGKYNSNLCISDHYKVRLHIYLDFVVFLNHNY